MTVDILIKPVPLLSPADSARKAHGVMSKNNISTVFVFDGAAVRGYVSEKSLSRYFAENPEASPEGSVESLITYDNPPTALSPGTDLKTAAAVFADSDLDSLPVVTSNGLFAGVVTRNDLLSYLAKTGRPAGVGGMATPIGVYLTTGSHTGGAGSKGVYLTGIVLGLMMGISVYLGDGIIRLIETYFNLFPRGFVALPLIGYVSAGIIETAAAGFLAIIFMLLMLRFSVLSGYHGAEHMTVHAIEREEDLTPETVSHMPRVHPRCGTNLMVAAALFLLISGTFGGQAAVFVAIIIVMLGWRAIGAAAQQHITTAKPNRKQLEAGIRAGKEIIESYRANPNLTARGFRRVWNMGFLQTMLGIFTSVALFGLIEYLLSR
ncbi:MAG: DUF1385 domain-containing protein [Abditibacteriota bacterium]|nr:DUF1385 domain-containing protein [Abditibacteriota bacterium]